ncbi:hypothetical protein F4678DRAFT_80233 [Xylaria arbuscula]|nr:hypothetical protein F4678DRAFT_80233 [Xylaria arbuscula]
MQMTTQDNNGPTLRYLLNQYPIQSRIMRDLDMGSILNLCRVSSGLRADIYTDTWDIDRKLERFFHNPRAFRTELGRAEALISGSFALQFFANRFWPESDLDINLREGAGAERLGKYLVDSEGYKLARQQDFDRDYEFLTRMTAIDEVLTYTKSSDGSSSSSQVRKVQLITTRHHPVQTILGSFYTSCIMNFISWNKAYCIFPRATLLFGETVPLKSPIDYDIGLHNKYSRRGWRQRTRAIDLSHPDGSGAGTKYPQHDIHPLGAHLSGDRRIGGSDTWTMQLDTIGVEQPEHPDSVLEYSSFIVNPKIPKEEEGMRLAEVRVFAFRSPSLRYEYAHGDLKHYWDYVGIVLAENTRAQLCTKMIKSEAEFIRGWQPLYAAKFEKPEGWDFLDDWLPEAYEELVGIEWSRGKKRKRMGQRIS